ncbi:MAG: hypothetical protein R3E88_02985 [Myxococcota bacterium]
MPITRRQLLGLGVAAGAASAAGLAALELAARRAGGPGLLELPAALADPTGVHALRVGRAWLRAHPAEADRAVLERLLGDLPEAARRGGLDLRDERVRAWLRARQRDDFADGGVVELDGWWLSQTEVRFCAWLAVRQA